MAYCVVHACGPQNIRFVSNLFLAVITMNILVTYRFINILGTNSSRILATNCIYEQIAHKTGILWTTAVDHTVSHIKLHAWSIFLTAKAMGPKMSESGRGPIFFFFCRLTLNRTNTCNYLFLTNTYWIFLQLLYQFYPMRVGATQQRFDVVIFILI